MNTKLEKAMITAVNRSYKGKMVTVYQYQLYRLKGKVFALMTAWDKAGYPYDFVLELTGDKPEVGKNWQPQAREENYGRDQIMQNYRSSFRSQGVKIQVSEI